jgi:outer membrane protein assembly factor BamA
MKPFRHVRVSASMLDRFVGVAGGLRSKAAWSVGACCLLLGLTAMAQDAPQVVPSFAELEAAGATVGEIRVIPLDIFDTNDPAENYALFRLANRLHIQTRESVIRRAILFQSGEPVSVRLIEETERLLRSNRYLYDVSLRPVAVQGGVVDIEVVTRDTWSLSVGAGVGTSGGESSSSVEFSEYNLFGTGTSLGFKRSNDVDRSSTEVEYANNRAFGTWASVSASHASNSDGRRNAVSVVRPFYALDSRWTAGFRASSDDRIDPLYQAGEIASEYRTTQSQAEVFGGWSDGLVDGWVRRHTLGWSASRVRYATEPGLAAPTQLPEDRRRVGPYWRYDLIEDRIERELNRNLIGRPEFFQLGLLASLQVNWDGRSFGSDRDALRFSAGISRGFEPRPGDTLIARAAWSGELLRSGTGSQFLSAGAQYYRPQTKRRLFYASAAADWIARPGPTDQLLLGGDSGLRGYPLRYQSGERRVLLTAEQRFYTDVYLWRLFRLGGAAFVDVGRAWGGVLSNTSNPGWLSDVGLGLRIVSERSSFGTVVHIDVALPLNRSGDISKVQFLVKAKRSF